MVKAASVGMPYGEPGAYWVLLGPTVSLRRADYDVRAAACEISDTSRWSQAGKFAADCVLRCVPADEALAYFREP